MCNWIWQQLLRPVKKSWFESRRDKRFSRLQNAQTGSVAHHTSCSVGTDGFTGSKVAGA